MDGAWVDRYLERIGAQRPAAPTPAALADLHRRHLQTVPFENLSIHLGEPIVLDEETLLRKIVAGRRGGFCYELNGAFAALLGALGFPVALLAAGVLGDGGGDGDDDGGGDRGAPRQPGPLFDHMALLVEAEGRHLADVGFGKHSLLPLRLDAGVPQEDPAGTFLLEPAGDGALDVLRDGRPQYRVETRPRRMTDFAYGCWWQQTSPDSHFRRNLVCTMPVEGGRITLSGRRLIRTTGPGKEETALGTDEEVLAAYRDAFGISLPAVPQVAGASTNPNQQAK